MKSALPGYAELHARIAAALGPTWRPLLIGIDGAMGLGKSSTASWLAWQFGMPVVHLDFYTDLASRKLTTAAGEVTRLIEYRIAAGRPIIVEGILLLEALDAIARQPDFLVYVDGEPDPDAKYSEYVLDIGPGTIRGQRRILSAIPPGLLMPDPRSERDVRASVR